MTATYYIAPADLLFYGNREMSHRSFQHPDVPNQQILVDIINGADLSGYDADEIAAGQRAYDRMLMACRLASGFVPRYLSKIPGAMPVPSPTPEVLFGPLMDVARWYLWDDNAETEVQERYMQAKEWFEAVAKGGIPFSYDTAFSGGNLCQVSAPDRVFTSETLSEY